MKNRPEQPVSRILFPIRVAPYRATTIHLQATIARRLLRPTRGLGRAALVRPSIWSCTGWGLPSFPGHPGNWCALTAPFHPCSGNASGTAGAVCFLLHFPSRCRDSVLRSTLPCGVRTFLRIDFIDTAAVCSAPTGIYPVVAKAKDATDPRRPMAKL